MQSEELQEELRRASERLAETDAELLRRHQAVGDLSRDLKAKGREVVQMRKDAQSAARYASRLPTMSVDGPTMVHGPFSWERYGVRVLSTRLS